ncbi:MAG: UDP-N-acetylmuramoyl-L-alanyl-D-glutamate synthetase [uncultured bacterium]|nr:MAG: UDP-N-acetylmuramoyl-L-alanyl-D-glutamate synthetase [uncultured bacterium]KKU14332.1 MAG: UDP-N-acetylmuramoylalanine-D-glutamate ligase [Microgenomates group bacterium GW2011_GWC2_45_8]KKU26495.1 MAG: UDP-N-acetylmuramoylalanine-D-glutamate ligase [Microgenomates group bacterium GW2011_GWA2_46_16]
MFGKNILILGFGREGISTFKHLQSTQISRGSVSIYDQHILTELSDDAQIILENIPKTNLYLGKLLTDLDFRPYDLIIKSPGIPNKSIPTDLWPKITTPTQLFFDACPAPIIGVTGTKGKSTTASLIHAMCKAAGKNSILLGNIGSPALDYLERITADMIVVFELSSHQLSRLTQSPHIAVLLGIYPEHLDYYQTMDEYVATKAKITEFQNPTDYLIYDSQNQLVQSIAHTSKAQLLAVTATDLKIGGSWLASAKLQGEMNAHNVATASKVASLLGIAEITIREAIQKFSPLSHRLENIGTYRGIIFYNDSLSTIPEATIAALDTLGNKVSTLILGGFERNLSYTSLAEDLLKRKSVKNLIFFPTTGKTIWAELNKLNPDAIRRYQIAFVNNMRDAIVFTYAHTPVGEICLLSPGATSFATFKDYRDRGDQFKDQVQKLSA